ncbi:MAG: hypothetical protein LBM99_02960 [Bacillales bacterium]|jgi:hypothetical protein|nr:hypothetical protein [Bacillales bacterium]
MNKPNPDNDFSKLGINLDEESKEVLKHTPPIILIGLIIFIITILILGLISNFTDSPIPIILIFVLVGLVTLGLFSFVVGLAVRDKIIVKSFKKYNNLKSIEAVYVKHLMGLNRMVVAVERKEIIGYNNDFCKIEPYLTATKINAPSLKPGDILQVVLNPQKPYCLVISKTETN